jgi:hypothetical protein
VEAGLHRKVSSQVLVNCHDILNIMEMKTAGHRFPIHLIPAPAIDLYDLKDYYRVRITWDERSWYLNDEHGYRLFSFDLSPVLFNLYAEHGILTRSKASDLKAEALNTMQALLVTENMTRLITFELDKKWVY